MDLLLRQNSTGLGWGQEQDILYLLAAVLLLYVSMDIAKQRSGSAYPGLYLKELYYIVKYNYFRFYFYKF